MNPVYFSRSELVRLLAAACVVASGFLAAQAQTYGPAAWVNDPFSTNINWTLINPNTTFPSYTNSGAVFNGNLFGNCPIGATITLTNPGDAAIFSGQVTLTGNVNASGNVQFRLGLYFKGANATDTGWAGYMIGNSTANGNGGLYLRNIPNTGIYGSGTLVLQGSNAILGPLNLNAGTLSFLSLANLPLSLGSITAVNFRGGVLQWASGNTFDLTSSGIPVNFIGNAGFDTGPNNVTFGTSFGDGGAGGLTKLGSGRLTLNGSASYTGTTTINNSVLALGAAGSIPTSANVTILPGATFDVTAPGGFTLASSGTLAGSGTVLGNVADSPSAVLSPGTNGPGTLVLRGSNPFTGTLNVDTGVPAGTDGILLIANPNAIANVVSPIAIRDNLGASSTLQLDGSSGSIVATQTVTLNGRSPTIPAIQNVAGTNTLAGGLTLNSGGARYFIQSDGGLLTLGGIVSSTTLDPQTITFLGNGDLSVTGVIQDGTNVVGVDKEGSGRLTLNGVNTYTGATTVNGGVLGGTGTISGPVSVSSGGTLSPGASIGTLTISNSLTLAGNTFVEVNKTTGASDQVVGLASVAYGGTLTVSNVSGALLPGDSFQIFPATAFSGNFTSITGAGMSWRFNPTNGVLTAVIPITPTNINFSVSGGNLTLSWPSGYTGWILQTQTNALSVGLATNWVDVAGSDTTNSITVPILPTNPTVFFRLRHPLN